MGGTNCDWCKKVLDEADLQLNDRRYAKYVRRYPDAGISDNFGDRPYFKILCAACTANDLHDQAEQRKRESFFDVLLQGDSHPDFQKNFLICCLVILGLLLLSGR
jgi:hypothetical protein